MGQEIKSNDMLDLGSVEPFVYIRQLIHEWKDDACPVTGMWKGCDRMARWLAVECVTTGTGGSPNGFQNF